MSNSNLKNASKDKFVEFGFIPQKLELEDRPEMNCFPLNILFANLAPDGRSARALYHAEFSSYQEKDGIKRLIYLNILSPTCKVEIIFDTKENFYHGFKYISDKKVGEAVGWKWRSFFLHLTMPGLSIGENCIFENLND